MSQQGARLAGPWHVYLSHLHWAPEPGHAIALAQNDPECWTLTSAPSTQSRRVAGLSHLQSFWKRSSQQPSTPLCPCQSG